MSTLPAPRGRSSLRVVQVLGRGSGGSAAHVRSLAAGLVARGVRVTVCAAADIEAQYDFTGTGARFLPLAPRPDRTTLTVLREACDQADVVHAHGLNAGLRAELALGGRHRRPLVVTWHTRGAVEGARVKVDRLLERRLVRGASVTLATCADLVDLARQRGARDARLAPLAVPGPRAPEGDGEAGRHTRGKLRAELGTVGRPLLLVVARLTAHQGHRVVLDAARSWRHETPPPLVVFAGEGELRGELGRRVAEEELPVRLLGRRDDVSELLTAADLVVLPSRWEARPLIAHEALRAGVPLVATDVGGTRELVGEGAALVPYGDATALARTVTHLLRHQEHRDALVTAGRRQAASWPTEDETVAQTLSVYDELTRS
ncbi:glycosyltransferase family 4 protein [Streptomyces sp. NPDC059740]|uniref:glycosyltransferase family 4 protein n=1 Tax=Streptomyces sp. NPDC059740 TaxID=3346926 RepID=UPI00365DAD5E